MHKIGICHKHLDVSLKELSEKKKKYYNDTRFISLT